MPGVDKVYFTLVNGDAITLLYDMRAVADKGLDLIERGEHLVKLLAVILVVGDVVILDEGVWREIVVKGLDVEVTATVFIKLVEYFCFKCCNSDY